MKCFRCSCALILALLLSGIALAKEKGEEGQKVDSGSFGVFMNGRRVGTETFSITQNANGSVIESEFKAEGSAGQAVQNSKMLLTANGEIRRYEWKEQSPGTVSYHPQRSASDAEVECRTSGKGAGTTVSAAHRDQHSGRLLFRASRGAGVEVPRLDVQNRKGAGAVSSEAESAVRNHESTPALFGAGQHGIHGPGKSDGWQCREGIEQAGTEE